MANAKQQGVVCLVLVLSLSAFTPLAAQVVQGSISGTLVDASGAGVPGAKITATDKGTGQVATATSDNSGLFRLPSLSIGAYDVEIVKSGFRKLKLTSVSVGANADSSMGNLPLELGEMTTTVEVTAAPPLLEGTQAQITTSISGPMLSQYPGISENEGLDFVALGLPGVNNARDISFTNTNGVGFAVNGLRERNNDQQIDGQNNNDNSVTGPSLFLSNIDFVQEYQITTNQFGPEYGRNSGSVVNIITKSGTNNWHGTVSGTESNSVLNTRDNIQKFFQKINKVPRFNDEFTGATIGGPFWKDHVFAFGGFDDEINSSSTVYSSGLLTPTPLGITQMAACFPNSTSVKALQGLGPYGIGGGNPTPSGAVVNKVLTIGTGPATCTVQMDGVQRALGDSFHEYDWVYKQDVVISNSDRFFARYLFQKQTFFNTDIFGGGGAAAGYPANVPSKNQQFGLSWTHTFSSRTINEVRLNFGRETVEFGSNTIGNTVPNQQQIGSALARISFSDPSLLGFGPNTASPQGRIVNTYQVQDNLNYLIGRHQIKAGANFTYQRSPNIFLPTFNGNWNYTDWSGFANNVPNSITVTAGNPSLDFREYDTFVYGGDDFKLRPNLTLNLGLTWSYYGQPANLFNQITTRNQSSKATALWNPALPLSVTTFPKIPAPKNSWGPSVGLAYTPTWGGWLTGHGKTVIRGGYRLTYDPPFYNIYLNISSSTPVVLSQTLTAGAALKANPLPAQPFGPAVRAQLKPFLTLGVFDPRTFPEVSITPNFGPDKAHEWSFGIQRELVAGAVLEARYVGNHGVNLFQSFNANPLVSGLASSFPKLVPSGVKACANPQAVGFGRESCNEGILLLRGNTGYSDYNSAQVEFRTDALWRQLTLRAGYTFSKATDNASEIFSSFAGGSTYDNAQNAFDIKKGEHGLSGFNIPQNFTVSFVEQIPFRRSQPGVLGHILGGWGFSGTATLSSGQPFTPEQIFLNTFSGGSAYDTPYDLSFIGVFETARPFVGSLSAPSSSVGIFAGDACALALVSGTICAAPNTLLDMNAANTTGTVKTVTKSQVRFIVNGGTADSIFGTPFGNAARNSLREYQVASANFDLFKDIKFWERVTLQWHMTMLDVFNHPSFGLPGPSGIDPFIEDAGKSAQGTGFDDPRLFTGGHRSIRFGLKVIF